MALWYTRRFGSARQMIDYLNGAVFSSVNIVNGALVDGLTLILVTDGAPITVTFAPAKSRAWTPAEIAAQINAGDATLAGVFTVFDMNKDRMQRNEIDLRLRCFRDGPLTIDKDGTANDLLGYSDAADTVQAAIATSAVKNVQRPATEQDTWILTLYM